MPPETAVATVPPSAPTSLRKPPAEALKQLEQVVLQGNLATLSENERIGYYARVCESLGLNPLTRPFEYITLNGKLTLYARKDATDQLRQLHGVNIVSLERERADDLQIVTASVRDRYGREDSAIGAVSIKGLSGEALANALMKAETKAKRRATLSIVGLGWMDEVEALDQRAVEVAPRAEAASAIRSRTAALTAANDPGESDASVPTGGAESEGGRQPSPSDGSPGCAHPAERHEARAEGVVCVDCGAVLAERPAEEAPATKPRTAGRSKKAEGASSGSRRRKTPTEDGYHRARAHGLAEERGLDPDAVKRIAGAVLGFSGDWSRRDMTEEQWATVAVTLEAAPVRAEDEAEWLATATVYAGNQATAAGIGKGDEDPWPAIDESAAEMFREDVEKLGPGAWIEYGLRIGAAA